MDVTTGEAHQVLSPTGQLIGVEPDGRHAVVLDSEHRPIPVELGASVAPPSGSDAPGETLAVLSRDGRFAALTGRAFPGILIYDVATHQEMARFVDRRPVIAIALSPDGIELVSSGFDSQLKVWRRGQAEPVKIFRAFLDPAWALAYSADGRSFAASGHNRQVKLWDTTDWREQLTLTGHESTTHCVAFSADSRQLVSGGEDEQALVWSLTQQSPPTEVRRLLRGPEWIDRSPDLAFSPDGQLLAGTAADGTVKVWQAATVKCIATFPAEARTVAFSPDGKQVLSDGFDGVVRQWDLGNARPEPVVPVLAKLANWQGGDLSSGDRIAFIANQRGTLGDCSLCAIPSARDTLNAGMPGACTTLAVTRSGDGVFVGLVTGEVEIWNGDHRKLLRRFAAHKLPVTAMAVSTDGHYLATGSLDNSTKLWDARSGELLATYFAHNRPVWALTFSPDGRILASGSCDKSILLCSVPLRRMLTQLWTYTGVPQGYEQEVRLLRFSPDGNVLAAALGDGTVHFFRAAPFAVTDNPRELF